MEQSPRTAVQQDAELAYAHDPRWLLVERILATPDFERSPRLSDFLRHICKLTLEGREAEISEQYLGETLFGRAPEYDSSADTIVRSHALRLRRRLEQYFQRVGKSEPLRLIIPRGGYVPIFETASEESAMAASAELEPVGASELETRTQTTPESAPPSVPVSPVVSAPESPAPEPDDAIGRYRLMLASLLGVVLALTVAVGYLWHSLHTAQALEHPRDRNHLLWGRLFNADEPTRIVLGDSGLVLFHATARRVVSLQDYVNNDLSKQLPYVHRADPEFALFLAGRRYTSVVDTMTAVQLLRLPEARPDRTLVNYSRDMRLDDFKNGNCVMIGAQEADPWVELFERTMDFVFSIDTPGNHAVFLNKHPLPGELSVYAPESTGAHQLYAAIAFLPNLNASGNVLILEGINMAGTESAVDLVLDDQRLMPILRKIRKPDGTLPHFEMLIATNAVKDSPTPAQVVALHVHP